ncbi:MAG: RNA polymerase sigma factor [Roseburia sp.]|nr:RNA polymerase sigma factor [Roseburia sp.]MCM1096815.1 RNA polymerase sigma factor [Ruminococcus flavefaciens]
MEDSRIVELYWARSENAIRETSAKYGRYCRAIAYNILASEEDADESVNDTYLDAWNTIPPHRPEILSVFLGKITRRIAIDRWRGRTAKKRGGGQTPLALDELEECTASGQDVEREILERELASALNAFLAGLSAEERDVFVCRYFFLLPVAEICDKFGCSGSKIKSMLFRTRKKLAVYLEKEGLI